jgi:hypothetical protein
MSEFREAMALQALVLIRVFDEFARQNQLKPFSAQIGSQDDVAFAVLTKSCSLIVVGRPEGGRRATAYVKNKERASTSIPSISQAIHGTTEIGSQMFIDGRHTSPVYKLYATDTGSSGGLEDMEASVAGLEESVASVQRQTIDSVSFRKLPD